MAFTKLQDAIVWIRKCPRPGPFEDLLVRVLSKNEREFASGKFQFSVSMFISLNVMVDDGFHGIRISDEENDHKWFTLGASSRGVVLRIGDGLRLQDTRYSSEEDAAILIRAGIRHLSDNTSPSVAPDHGNA